MFKKLIFINLVLILLYSSPAFAQKKGISVTPSIAHIDLATDPYEYTLTYENNTNTDVTLLLSLSGSAAGKSLYRYPKENLIIT